MRYDYATTSIDCIHSRTMPYLPTAHPPKSYLPISSKAAYSRTWPPVSHSEPNPSLNLALTLALALTKAAGSRGRGEAARERCEALRRRIAQLGEDTAAAAASIRALQTERAKG